VTAEHLVWSSGREQEHTCTPRWGGGLMDPGRSCRATVRPAHGMKQLNTQSSGSECGSGVAEGREWGQEVCGRGAKRAIL